jgi:hypothetical protein
MMNGTPSDHSDAIERMNRFVQRMNEVDRKLTAPYVAPKDAATLILVDRSARRPKVLLGKRHARHKFMPGKFVFPGGRVDPGDKRMPVARPLNPDAQANLMKRLARASPAKAHGFALAAIRETFGGAERTLGGIRASQDPAGSRRLALHRARDHAARPAASLRRAFLHPGCKRNRASHRRGDRP